MKRLTLDGQVLHLAERGEEDTLLREGAYDGLPIGALRIVRAYPPILRAHPELRLALTKYRPDVSRWAVVILLEVGQFTRVSLETRSCANCDWSGYVGYSLFSDLFVGVPDKAVAKERARKHAAVRCPGCRAELGSGVIWVEEDSSL